MTCMQYVVTFLCIPVSSELRGHLIYLGHVLSRQQTKLYVIVKGVKDMKYLRNS